MKIILANPRGWCAGVSRAVDIVHKVLEHESSQVYVRHEVVHNRAVVQDLKNKGVIFVKELDEVPDNSVCIFSAHGISKEVQDSAKNKNLKVYDACCPLVIKVHKEVQKARADNKNCILIGHKGHPEVEGTLGQYDNSKKSKIHLVENIEDVNNLNISNSENLTYVTQTTLSIDETENIIKALKKKYPLICGPKKEDICYATQNRQNAVRSLAKEVDMILVVGSKNSSNSNRLCELARNLAVDAYLIDGVQDIHMNWFENKNSCAITAGASAPEYLVKEVVNFLASKFTNTEIINYEGIQENVIFPLPKLLKDLINRKQSKKLSDS